MTPLDLDRLKTALASPHGFIELAVAASCIALAWAAGRRIADVRATRGALQPGERPPGIAFALLATVLTFVASFAWSRLVGAPFFLAITLPLLVALTVIRSIGYGLRRLFPKQAWLSVTEFAVGTTIWTLAALHFLGVLPEITRALDQIVIPLGKSQVSLLAVIRAAIAVAFTIVVALWISGLIEARLMSATHLDANMRVVLTKMISALLIVVATLIALEQIGFDLTLLGVFGGALGVGIGLGLQKLASNYIAGFTILIDRSVRLGDLVTVDGRTGVVTKVASRYMVVRSNDGIEAIVPNETLVTTTVLNHSFTSTETRVALTIRITYDSDVDQALALLRDVALRDPRVLGEGRAPTALIQQCGDDGIVLELGAWVRDSQVQGTLRSALYREILRAFDAAGLRIAAPRRDVTLASADGGRPDAAVPGSAPESTAGR